AVRAGAFFYGVCRQVWAGRKPGRRRRRCRTAAAASRPLLALRTNCLAMLQFREFLKSGHAPTLWSSFLYFGFSCAIWVINGAMAPFIRDSLSLTPTQMGMMLSIPIFAGALLRFPLGILAQYIGRKKA